MNSIDELVDIKRRTPVWQCKTESAKVAVYLRAFETANRLLFRFTLFDSVIDMQQLRVAAVGSDRGQRVSGELPAEAQSLRTEAESRRHDR